MGNLKNALIAYKEDHQDITWADMADAIGISLGSLFNYVNGKAKPRTATLTMIAKVLEINADALLETEEEPEEAEKDIIEPVPPEDDKEEPEEEEKTTVHIVAGNTMPKKKDDVVNHPSHYCTGKYECIEVMTEVFGKEAVQAFCRCNAFKYLYRSDRKNGVEDIKKARWYINKFIDLEEENNGKE